MISIVHGTEEGWRWHRKNGQQPCDLCAEAHRNTNDQRNKARKQKVRWPA